MSTFDGIICGDSDALIDQMIEAGEKFDLVLTDPPYNINKDFGNDSDKLTVEEFIEVTNKRMEKLKKVLNPYSFIKCKIDLSNIPRGLYKIILLNL